MKSFLNITFTVVLGVCVLRSSARADVVIPESVGVFLKTHCYRCHGPETQEADLSLHDITLTIVDSADAVNWQDILDRLNAGEMPPADEPQPLPAEVSQVVGDLTEVLHSAQKMLR
ncbi:MAG: c-type cytochrome domain-containing protein, partial [Pirellulales bacterium]